MKQKVKEILEDVKKGTMSIEEALRELKHLPFEDIEFAKIDHHRSVRKACGEVIYCPNKTKEQIVEITKKILAMKSDVLLSRADEDIYQALKKLDDAAVFNPHCKSIVIKHTVHNTVTKEQKKKGNDKRAKKGSILIITAGTSDIPIAEEAKVTAEFLDNKTETLYDVGVAGIHRLLNNKEAIERANVIIVVAGMEGALPSVVSGLFEKPIIAVPTSVGYGASFKGLAPLLTMLNACSPGIVVVNIDNGFGAGYFASLINITKEQSN